MSKGLLLFDGDGTLIEYKDTLYSSAWDALGVAAGLEKQFRSNANKYWPEKGRYSEWVEADVSLLKGMEFEPIKNQLIPPPYAPGVKELFNYIKGKYVIGLLTGGLSFVAEYIHKDLGLDFYIANEVGITDGKFDGSWKVNMELWTYPDKAYFVKEMMKKYNTPKEKTIMIGDHENDLTAGKEAGIFIARKPKTDLVRQKADYVLEDRLDDLIPILKNLKK